MLALDFETDLFGPGYQVPFPVCLSVGHSGGAELYPTDELAAKVEEALDSGETIVGVNLAYDMHVSSEWCGLAVKVRAAYQDGRVIDLAVLDHCAQIEGRTTIKRPSMAGLCQAYGVPHADKEGEERLTFAQYYGLPLSDYSPGHVTYALDDGHSGYALGKRLLGAYGNLIPAAAVLSRKQFWLAAARNRGLKTHPERVQRLAEVAAVEYLELLEIAQESLPLPARREFIRGAWVDMLADTDATKRPVVRPDGSRDMARLRAWVSVAYDGNPPMTVAKKDRKSKKPFVPQVKTSKEVLAESGDPYLEQLERFGEWAAILNKDLKYLTSDTIHTRFWLAASTRATSSSPNVQNPRRAPGIRECIVPRPGHCFVAADHIGLELVTAAQGAVSLLNRWDMADKLNAGKDLHVLVGADIAGASYEECLAGYKAKAMGPKNKPWKEYRQLGKVPNFGCLGGLTRAATLAIYARGQGVRMTEAEAEAVLASWRRANPDGQALLDYVKWRLPKWGHGFAVPIPGIDLVRRGAPFCAAANTLFQGRAAVLEAHVGWAIYCATQDPASPLYGSHLVHFVHDEFILEVPIGRQTEVGLELGRIMRDAAQPHVPDVKIDSEVTAMNCWSKKAEPLWKDGELLIWEYKEAA